MNIWGEKILDGKDDKDPESVVQKLATEEEALKSSSDEGTKEKEKCTCEKEMDIDTMIEMIYFLRQKQNYKTFKERFFDSGSEYISSIRADTTKKLSDSRTEVGKYVDQLNATFAKFNINTCLRKIHFLAQSYLETASFRATYESRTEVPSNYKGGVSFQGRGMKQITHDYNYLAYYDYINGTNWFNNVYMKYRKGYEGVGEFIENNPKAGENGMDAAFYNTLKQFAKNLSEDLFHAFNSAGWFISIYTAGLAKMDSDDVEGLTKTINGGTNNLTERQNYTKWLKEFFGYSETCK